MDSKFYVSLEAARLLKEKGYDEKCTFAYTDISNGSDINGRIVFNSNDYPVGIYPCPTKAEVIDWLEGKGMLVWAEPTCEDIWMWFIISPLHFEDNTETNNISYPTRLEAEEAAIIKALEILNTRPTF
jgi:hypothetical protein